MVHQNNQLTTGNFLLVYRHFETNTLKTEEKCLDNSAVLSNYVKLIAFKRKLAEFNVTDYAAIVLVLQYNYFL